MHVRRLDELKKLQFQRGAISPFKGEIELHTWADSVKPLLSFDTKLQNAFAHQITIAKINYTGDNINAINEAIGILNQAILSLETTAVTQVEPKEIAPQPQKLEAPAKLTLKWLVDHAPWSIYVWLFGALVIAFSAGRELGKIESKVQSNSLANPASTPLAPANATTKAIDVVTPMVPSQTASTSR